jgi:hypothetical protein
MTFTLIFKSIERNLSYQLCFEPSPIWRKIDHDWHLIPNRSSPHYQLGYLAQLLKKERIRLEHKKCIIVIQEEGHGSEEDFHTLKLDLENEGFQYKAVVL